MGRCRHCLHGCVPFIPVTIVAFAYYLYSFEVCLKLITDQTQAITYIVIATILLVMVAWSFFGAMCKPVAVVPKEYRLSNSEHQIYLSGNDDQRNIFIASIISRRNLLIYTCTADGRYRYCLKCRHIKPDRCHHCNTCEVCVLKMDHHCPWINNCVGFSNYKYFFLLCFYLSCLFLYCSITSLERVFFLIQHFDKEFTLSAGGMILSTISFIVYTILYGYHVKLISRNETTLESLRENVFCEGNFTFDLGCCLNIKQVMGENKCLWIFPVFTSLGNGHTFHVYNKDLMD